MSEDLRDIKDIIELILSNKKKINIKNDIDIVIGSVPDDMKGCISYLRTLIKFLLLEIDSNERERNNLYEIILKIREEKRGEK